MEREEGLADGITPQMEIDAIVSHVNNKLARLHLLVQLHNLSPAVEAAIRTHLEAELEELGKLPQNTTYEDVFMRHAALNALRDALLPESPNDTKQIGSDQ